MSLCKAPKTYYHKKSSCDSVSKRKCGCKNVCKNYDYTLKNFCDIVRLYKDNQEYTSWGFNEMHYTSCGCVTKVQELSDEIYNQCIYETDKDIILQSELVICNKCIKFVCTFWFVNVENNTEYIYYDYYLSSNKDVECEMFMQFEFEKVARVKFDNPVSDYNKQYIAYYTNYYLYT